MIDWLVQENGGLLEIQREVGGGISKDKKKRKKNYEVKVEYPGDGGGWDQDGDQTKTKLPWVPLEQISSEQHFLFSQSL